MLFICHQYVGLVVLFFFFTFVEFAVPDKKQWFTVSDTGFLACAMNIDMNLQVLANLSDCNIRGTIVGQVSNVHLSDIVVELSVLREVVS